jgi:hypothetical protein
MKSDVELEWQRRRFRVRSCRQDFTDKVGEPQRDRQAVGKGGTLKFSFVSAIRSERTVSIGQSPRAMSAVNGVGTSRVNRIPILTLLSDFRDR